MNMEVLLEVMLVLSVVHQWMEALAKRNQLDEG